MLYQICMDLVPKTRYDKDVWRMLILCIDLLFGGSQENMAGPQLCYLVVEDRMLFTGDGQ